MAGIGFIILASLCWALDGPIRYPLLQSGVSASRIVFTEHLFLTLLFLPIFVRQKSHGLLKFKRLRPGEWAAFLAVGAFGSALATLAFTRAFLYLNPTHVILLQKLQPVVAIFLANLFLKERLDKHFAIWAMVCLSGGLIIGHREIVQGVQELFHTGHVLSSLDAYKGIGLALVAVLGWGGATVFGKKLSAQGFSTAEIMAGRYLAGFVVLLPLPLAGLMEVDAQPNVWLKIFGLVLLSGLLGMFLYYQGLKRLSARLTSLTEMFFPFLAVVVNWIWLGATLDLGQVFGAIILLVGSMVIQKKHY
ncbi:MAG: DMT family transporter [Bdellovibrio sp.]|nr:DMT family transporter [Bdellovibrio sp.]